MNTPWGKAQEVKEIASGITLVSTASHGGYHISAERLRAMPDALQAHAPWAGKHWYEEDCDWAILALAFPDDFEPYAVFQAVETARFPHASLHKTAGVWLESQDPAAKRPLQIHAQFLAEHGTRFTRGTSSTSGDGWWVTCTTLDRKRVEQWTLPGDTYEKLPYPTFTAEDVQRLIQTYEEAKALGFSSIEQCEKHQVWLKEQAAHRQAVNATGEPIDLHA